MTLDEWRKMEIPILPHPRLFWLLVFDGTKPPQHPTVTASILFGRYML